MLQQVVGLVGQKLTMEACHPSFGAQSVCCCISMLGIQLLMLLTRVYELLCWSALQSVQRRL
jgi:hypothetical protein